MLRIEFETTNAAFDEGQSLEHECSCVLFRVARMIEKGTTAGNVYDRNGNTIGQFDIEASRTQKKEQAEIFNSLVALTECAKMSGPAGTTAYLISDERMNNAQAVIAKYL